MESGSKLADLVKDAETKLQIVRGMCQGMGKTLKAEHQLNERELGGDYANELSNEIAPDYAKLDEEFGKVIERVQALHKRLSNATRRQGEIEGWPNVQAAS